ncbi:MAG: hypothetical protein ACR2JE_12450 [Acidobacteriaceae bacterium]
MTVCIAGLAEHNTIVAVSDMMVSGYLGAADSGTIKCEDVHQHWQAMMAADDLTQCMPIIEKARAFFEGRANTLQVARSVFKRAYQAHLREMAEDQVLGRFGIDMATFLESGRHRFGESLFASLSNEIRAVATGTEFLIFGHSDDGEAHLFIVADPGIDSVYDKPGFCAIGAGAHAANGLLFYLGQSRSRTMPESLFNVCAAKFMAEKIPGVGQQTFLFVQPFGTSVCRHNSNLVRDLRKLWEKSGEPRVPDGAMSVIERAKIVTY